MPRGLYLILPTALAALILPVIAGNALPLSIRHQAQNTNAIKLEPDQPLKLDFSPRQTRVFHFFLDAGQYASVSLDERESWLIMQITSPSGKILIGEDSRRFVADFEQIPFLATESGTYTIKLRPDHVWGGPWKSEIKLEAHTTTGQDESRINLWKTYQEAVQLYFGRTPEGRQQSIKKLETARQIAIELHDRDQEAKVVLYAAKVYGSLNEPQKSLDYYKEALSIFNEVGDNIGQSDALFYMAIKADKPGREREALKLFEESLPLAEAAGNLPSITAAHGNMARLYVTLGDYTQAIEQYKLSIDILRHIGTLSSIYHQWGEVGEIYASEGDVQKALASYNEALQIAQEAKDDPPCKPLLNMGYLYDSMNDLQSALYYFEQARPVCARQNYSDEAAAITGLGAVNGELGDQQKAVAYFQDALDKQRKMKDTWGEGLTLGAWGLLLNSNGDKQQALKNLTEALTLFHNDSDWSLESTALNEIGNIYLDLNQADKAKESFTKALEISESVGHSNNRAAALFGLSRIERDSGHLAQAADKIELSIATIESERAKIPSYTLRSTYLSSVSKYYEFYVDLLMSFDKQDPSKTLARAAFETNERARARSLLEMLNESGVDIHEGVSPDLLQRESAVKRSLNARTNDLMKLFSSSHSDKQYVNLKKSIDSLVVQYQSVQSEIRTNSPRYAALTQPRPLTLKEIQTQVLDSDTLLLEYALGDDHSYLWAVTQNSLKAYEIPKRKEVEQRAQHLLELLTARQPKPGESEAQWSKRVADADAAYSIEAGAISKMLIGPVAGLSGYKRLAVVADGALQYIPFAALPETEVGKNQPLIVNHEIVSLPSASLLAVERRNLQKRTIASKSLAVIADPVFEKNDPRIKQFAANMKANPLKSQMDQKALLRAAREVEGSDRGFSRLLYSRVEANKILSTVGVQSDRFAAMDFAANRTTVFSNELSKYRYIHFATHGLLDEVHPELSGLVLSLIDEKGQQQDGFLRLHDIYNLKLSADLVVLSACRTGLGKQIKGEGLVGLTQGFMYAGSPRVVASLWKVQDDSTAELMSSFYSAMLKEGKRPAAALREAQLAMLRKKQWQAPFYWAAFAIQGEWK